MKDNIKIKLSEEIRASRKEKWEWICGTYLKVFCDKHDLQYDEDCWVAGNIGTIAEICDMYIDMYDIRYDIDNDIPEEKFMKWYWQSVDAHEEGSPFPNYKNFCKGAPTNIPKETPEEAHKRIRALKESLEALAEEEAAKRKARIEKAAYEYSKLFKSIIVQQAAKAAFIKGASCTDMF